MPFRGLTIESAMDSRKPATYGGESTSSRVGMIWEREGKRQGLFLPHLSVKTAQ